MGTTVLVERVGAIANRAEPESTCVVPGAGRVSADADLADEPRGIALAHTVARRPGDARNHVERINHHLSAGDAEGVNGAVVDLYRVTADAQRVRDLVAQLPPAAAARRWHLLIEELSP